MSVPECFHHVGVLRTGKYYKNLSNHQFTGVEKDFICLEAAKRKNDELLIDPFPILPIYPKTFTGAILERYRINGNKFRSWQRSILKGKHNRDGNPIGRPLSVDKISRDVIKRTIISAEKDVHPLRIQQTHDLFIQERIETLKRQKLEPHMHVIDKYNTSISSATVTSIKRRPDMRIFDRVPQDLTEARLLALKCYRLAYITMCFIWGLCRHLPPANKWNADCTTFECRPSGSGKFVCVVREKGDGSQVDFMFLLDIFSKYSITMKVTSVSSSGELNLLVKYFGLGNAAGNIGPTVLIVAIKDMPDDQLFVKEVIGLTSTSTVGDRGWLYFCKTKGGTASMWRHWFTNVCIPTIKNAADVLDIKDEQGIRYRSFLSTDGEACILNEAFDETVLHGFKDASIDYLKLGPSSTSSWQPWDVCDLFRGTKSGMAKVVREGTEVEDDLLRRSLTNYFTDFHLHYPDVSMSHNFKKKIIYSTMLIVYTLKKYLRPHQMTIGFIRSGNTLRMVVDTNNILIGQHVEGEFIHGKESVDCEAMMAKCRDPEIPHSEHVHAMALREHCADYGLEKGMISEEFLDELGIYSTPGSINRDMLTECRQHAFLVTHQESIARHRETILNRSKKQKDSSKDAEQKRRKADLAIVEKMQAAQARKLQKEIQRGIEKERFAALSPEEQKREREGARAAAVERRKLKEAEKQEKFEAARARLARGDEKVSAVPLFEIVDENSIPGNIYHNI